MSMNPIIQFLGISITVYLVYKIFSSIGKAAGTKDSVGYEGISFWGGFLLVVLLLCVILALIYGEWTYLIVKLVAFSPVIISMLKKKD